MTGSLMIFPHFWFPEHVQKNFPFDFEIDHSMLLRLFALFHKMADDEVGGRIIAVVKNSLADISIASVSDSLIKKLKRQKQEQQQKKIPRATGPDQRNFHGILTTLLFAFC